MPYLTNWDEFAEKSKELVDSDPNCRVCLKYRHKDGNMVMKVTNNVKSYQYLVAQPKEVKNVDRFMSLVMRNMTTHT